MKRIINPRKICEGSNSSIDSIIVCARAFVCMFLNAHLELNVTVLHFQCFAELQKQ